MILVVYKQDCLNKCGIKIETLVDWEQDKINQDPPPPRECVICLSDKAKQNG